MSEKTGPQRKVGSFRGERVPGKRSKLPKVRTAPGGNLCHICGSNIFEHPLVACWREAQ